MNCYVRNWTKQNFACFKFGLGLRNMALNHYEQGLGLSSSSFYEQGLGLFLVSALGMIFNYGMTC